MAIKINLEEQMREKNYTVAKLAEEIGISPVNVSNIKNGNVVAMRFSTLNELCRVLECQPGDILEYEEREKKKVIPMFLDYSGTTDLLLRGGAENVKRFFESIKYLEHKTGYEVNAIIVTGSVLESASSKFEALQTLAENYGLENLFKGAIAEYCGYYVQKDKCERLNELDIRILSNRTAIEVIANKYGGVINPKCTSLYNLVFDDITRVDLAKASEELEELMKCYSKEKNPINVAMYYDEYGKEIDIKTANHSKSNAVIMLMDKMKEECDIPFAIIGGDSQEEDLKMYTNSKDILKKEGNIDTVFIAPSNIGKIATYDKNVIIGNWENSDGISQAINQLTDRIKVKEEGEIEL